jgi:hypothetical protein
MSKHTSAGGWLVRSNDFLTHTCGTRFSTDSRLVKYATQAQYRIPPSEQILLHCRCILRRPKKFLWHVQGICRAILGMIRMTNPYAVSARLLGNMRGKRPCQG